MSRRGRRQAVGYFFLVPTSLALALPVFWIVLLSFRPDSVIVSGLGSLTSPHFVLDNYILLFENFNTWRYILNSLIACVVPAVVSVFFAVLAGYALVRYRFAGRSFFVMLPLLGQLVPLIQLIVPLYVVMLTVHLLNTYLAVMIVHLLIVLPFSVWMMSGYLRGVPREVEEAGLIDGCSRLGIIVRIVVPIALPGIAATFIYAFLETWGEFLVAYILTSTEDMRLLAVAVYTFLPGGQSPTTWGILFAAATIFMTPSIVLFLLLQRFIREGGTVGAVAGM
jgi:ABC-type glycerol-3-phosphate transport system permease component